MEKRMLGYEHAPTVSEIVSWANNVVGKEVPGDSGYLVVNVIQFQFLQSAGGYAALLLAEVTERLPEDLVTLKAADIIAIEEMTSVVDTTLDEEAV